MPNPWLNEHKSTSAMNYFLTINNTFVISWWSVLLVEKAAVFGKNNQPDTKTGQMLSYKFVKSETSHDWNKINNFNC